MFTGPSNFSTFIRRIIVISIGVVLEIVGIIMLYQGITAEGVVDLKTQLFSGKITSTSAGLFVMIIGLFPLLIPVLKSEKSVIEDHWQTKGGKGGGETRTSKITNVGKHR